MYPLGKAASFDKGLFLEKDLAMGRQQATVLAAGRVSASFLEGVSGWHIPAHAAYPAFYTLAFS